MTHLIRMAAAGALLGAFSFAPAFAQDGSSMSCEDFNSSTPEQQAEAVDSMLMTMEGAEGTEKTNEEITSMLSEKCNEFPDTQAADQLRDLPLGIKN